MNSNLITVDGDYQKSKNGICHVGKQNLDFYVTSLIKTASKISRVIAWSCKAFPLIF